jgi:protein gp37
MYREKTTYGQDPSIVVRSSKKTFSAPLTWNLPKGARIFTCSWSDFFHERADEWRPEAWSIIKKLPQYTFLVLTKRPERIADHLPEDWGNGWDNAWLGTTAEDQPNADKRIRQLLKVPASKYFVSVEPMIGAVDLTKLMGGKLNALTGDRKTSDGEIFAGGHGLDWVIAGAESGPQARPCNIEWVRKLRDQCVIADIPFFLKQLNTKGGELIKMPKLDGRVWDQVLDRYL